MKPLPSISVLYLSEDDATAMAGDVVDAVLATDPVCALSQATFSEDQLQSMLLCAVPCV